VLIRVDGWASVATALENGFLVDPDLPVSEEDYSEPSNING
jgi:hypothetical protein